MGLGRKLLKLALGWWIAKSFSLLLNNPCHPLWEASLLTEEKTMKTKQLESDKKQETGWAGQSFRTVFLFNDVWSWHIYWKVTAIKFKHSLPGTSWEKWCLDLGQTDGRPGSIEVVLVKWLPWIKSICSHNGDEKNTFVINPSIYDLWRSISQNKAKVKFISTITVWLSNYFA